MDEKTLRKVCKCSSCGKGIGHTGIPLFWIVEVKRYGLLAGAIKRQTGLEMQLDNHVALAQVFSPNEKMAEKILGKKFTFCETCMQKHNMRLLTFLED